MIPLVVDGSAYRIFNFCFRTSGVFRSDHVLKTYLDVNFTTFLNGEAPDFQQYITRFLGNLYLLSWNSAKKRNIDESPFKNHVVKKHIRPTADKDELCLFACVYALLITEP